jgi:hypothetical protein
MLDIKRPPIAHVNGKRPERLGMMHYAKLFDCHGEDDIAARWDMTST